MIRSNRTSIIASSSQVSSDDSHASSVLSVSTIIDRLHELGISATEDDFIKPTGYRMRQIFLLFIEIMLPFRVPYVIERKEKISNEFESTSFSEEMVDSIPIYKELKVLLTQLKYRDFQLIDVTSPTPERNRAIVTALLNFAAHRSTSYNEFDEVTGEASKLDIKARELMREHNLLSDIYAYRMEKYRENRAKAEKLHEDIKGLYETCVRKREILRNSSDTAAEAKRRKTQWQLQFRELTNTLTKLHHDVVCYDELTKTDLGKLQNDKDELYKKADECNKGYKALIEESQKLSTIYTTVKSLGVDMERCVVLLKSLSKIKGESIRHEKTNDALRKEIAIFENLNTERDMMLATIKRSVEYHSSKLEKLRQQQEKKRESLKLTFDNYRIRMNEAQDEIREKELEVREYERHILKTQQEMKRASVNHKNELNDLMVKLKPIIIYIKKTQEQLQHLNNTS
ncbi:MAG: Nuf2 family-domain-containing protein [Benjaminiella poitrasii]|nr:MAG: Nuf2 family-domain-containing protein [Benjaminiella poitrasii]